MLGETKAPRRSRTARAVQTPGMADVEQLEQLLASNETPSDEQVGWMRRLWQSEEFVNLWRVHLSRRHVTRAHREPEMDPSDQDSRLDNQEDDHEAFYRCALAGVMAT